MRSIFCGMIIICLFSLIFASDVIAGYSLSQADLSENVIKLSEIYRGRGEAESIARMKAVRRQIGSSVIFTILDIQGRAPGKILYHPTPFVTGHFIQQAKDADGRSHGHELLQKAQKTAPGMLFWVEYSVKSVSEGRVFRQMCCVRINQSAVCGLMPSTGTTTP